jgi:hypothetical protein
VEQLEQNVLNPSLEERSRFLDWLFEHEEELLGLMMTSTPKSKPTFCLAVRKCWPTPKDFKLGKPSQLFALKQPENRNQHRPTNWPIDDMAVAIFTA